MFSEKIPLTLEHEFQLLNNNNQIQQVKSVGNQPRPGTLSPNVISSTAAKAVSQPSHVKNVRVRITRVSDLSSRVTVTFKRDPNDYFFSNALVHVIGYKGNPAPVQIASGQSPVSFALENTGEPVSVAVQANGSLGPAPLGTAPNATLQLRSTPLATVPTSGGGGPPPTPPPVPPPGLPTFLPNQRWSLLRVSYGTGNHATGNFIDTINDHSASVDSGAADFYNGPDASFETSDTIRTSGTQIRFYFTANKGFSTSGGRTIRFFANTAVSDDNIGRGSIVGCGFYDSEGATDNGVFFQFVKTAAASGHMMQCVVRLSGTDTIISPGIDIQTLPASTGVNPPSNRARLQINIVSGSAQFIYNGATVAIMAVPTNLSLGLIWFNQGVSAANSTFARLESIYGDSTLPL